MENKKVLWFASANIGKINDLKEILGDEYEIKSLLDLNKNLEIVENGLTFEQNAMIKAKKLAKLINAPVLANDAGLVVEALNGFPGIYSKRWANTSNWDEINQKLLKKMKNINNRNAQFVDVFAYFDPNKKTERYFKDVLIGQISYDFRKTNNGYGYDPIFQHLNSKKTLSELSDQERNYRFDNWKIELKKLIES